MDTNVPLLVLIKAAENGNEKEVEEYAVVFTEHSNKLVEVSIVGTHFLMLTICHYHEYFASYSTTVSSS